MTLCPRRMQVALILGLAGTAIAGSLSPAMAAVENYRLDPNHSTIGYSLRHIVSNFTGAFRKFKGTIVLDPADYSTAKVDVTIWANAIDSGNAKRDQHLMSADFFNSAVDSLITFKSTSVKPSGTEGGTMTGDLTMRGVTKPVTLNYTVLGFFEGERGKKAGFEATGVVSRRDFGINWNNEMSPGKLILSDEVKLNLQIEANQFDPNAPPPSMKK